MYPNATHNTSSLNINFLVTYVKQKEIAYKFKNISTAIDKCCGCIDSIYLNVCTYYN